MSAPEAGFQIKGWCPGALRPMQSGDGMIVRVRPFCASLSLAEMHGIAEAAARYGNGHIDFTRRANLQIRGVGETALGPLQDALRALGLLDERPEVEAARNILISPLAGLDPAEALDMRPLARALADGIAAESALWRLPGKFAVVLDGGGRLPLSAERADLRIQAIPADGAVRIALGIDGASSPEWLGAAEPENATAAALLALRSIAADLAQRDGGHAKWPGRDAIARIRAGLSALHPEAIPAGPPPARADAPVGLLAMGNGGTVLGLGAPFGRLEAVQFHALVEALAKDGDAPGIRLSPWRVFYIPLRDRAASDRLMARARSLEFVTEAGDPLMRIQACPGRPACRAAHADTREDARGLAAWMRASGFPGTAHVSGCAKGCASSAPADLTLVGVPGGYRLMRDARARDEGGIPLAPTDIFARLDALAGLGKGARHG